jgi:hypothetical protein
MKISMNSILIASDLGANTDQVPKEIRKQFPEESESLGAFLCGRALIGRTPGVNDESAKLVTGFRPTRYELAVLAEHYLNTALEIEHWWESTSVVGSSEVRMEDFAWRRLGTIREMLGQEEYDEATSSTWNKWNKKFKELAALPRCEHCGVKYDPDYHDPATCSALEPTKSGEDCGR